MVARLSGLPRADMSSDVVSRHPLATLSDIGRGAAVMPGGNYVTAMAFLADESGGVEKVPRDHAVQNGSLTKVYWSPR